MNIVHVNLGNIHQISLLSACLGKVQPLHFFYTHLSYISKSPVSISFPQQLPFLM